MKQSKICNIVLLVYNRPKHTEQAITSLYNNTLDKKLNSANGGTVNDKPFDLFVVDDKSENETRFLLRKLQDQYGFKIIRNEENLGPGESRNKACSFISKLGIRKKYLYFSDNDVYFTKNWFEILLDLYKKVSTQRVGLLGGGCHPYLKNNEVIDLGDYKVGIKDAVSGYSHLITWELWDRFGPFDNQKGLDKKTGRSDDWKFCQDIKASGLKVGAVEPEIVISTGKLDSYGDLAVGQETFKKHEGIFIG